MSLGFCNCQERYIRGTSNLITTCKSPSGTRKNNFAFPLEQQSIDIINSAAPQLEILESATPIHVRALVERNMPHFF